MTNFTKELNARIEPSAALIVYVDTHTREPFIEVRQIIDGQFCAGKPVSEEFLLELTSKMSTIDRPSTPYSSGLFPSNILSLDQRTSNLQMTWYIKPGKRMMHFSKDLNIPDGMMHLPGLIFRCKGNNLHVVAYQGTTPNQKSILCKPPFFNTGESGSVCLGDASTEWPKDPTYQSIMEYWEKMFFGSIFTHLAGSSNPTRSNLATLTKKLIKSGTKFPEDQLVKLKMKLTDFIHK